MHHNYLFKGPFQVVNESAIWLSTIQTTYITIFWSFNLSSFKNTSTLQYQVIQNENYTKGKKTYFKRHTLMNNAYYETTPQFFSAVFSNINLFRIQRQWGTLLPYFSKDNAHLMYNTHPKHFRYSFWCINNAHLMYNAHPKLFRHFFWCIDNAHDAN
jgi:hypothetical protein